MVRTLSKNTQNNIKNLLKFDYFYSTFIKRILGVQRSTIHKYKRKFFPNMMAPSLSGRLTLISATFRITFPKRLYYFKCLKMLKSMGFKAEKKRKNLCLQPPRSKWLKWANAHKSLTSNSLQRIIFSDKAIISI